MARASRAAAVTVTGAVVALASAATLAAQTRPQGPTATYWVTAETSTGMGLGGGNPMAMLSGGARRDLHLELESRLTPNGAPAAEHLPPKGLKAGPSLPLLSQRPNTGASPRSTGEFSGDKPKGRMLIYWGCGEVARPGQPMVIDLAKMTGGSLPDLGIRAAVGPSAGGGRTYGEWPNEKSRTRVPTDGSLIGDHVVRGNYTPDIKFSLGVGQDFMDAFKLTGVSTHTKGSVPLGWQAISGAKGYFASTMGVAENGDMILWSSSDIALSAAAVPTHLSPDEIQALLRRKVILSPQTTRCAIPAQVANAAPESMLRVIGFGGEVNFSYPPRPADPKAPWTLEHVTKVRYATTASTILGMPDMDDGSGDGEDEASVGGSLLGGGLGSGLGGLIGGAPLSGAGDKVRSLLKKPAPKAAPPAGQR